MPAVELRESKTRSPGDAESVPRSRWSQEMGGGATMGGETGGEGSGAAVGGATMGGETGGEGPGAAVAAAGVGR